MISDAEMQAYIDLVKTVVTPEPDATVAPYTYNPDELSCYGYVTTDAVNFRAEPSSSSRRIRLMKRYALFMVYGTVEADGETWYKVSYNRQDGYLNGKYFTQMTVGEAEDFLASSKYQEGIANNRDTGTSADPSAGTTGTPTGIVSAEDQKVSEWVNPATGSQVSYEPFDPFATPAPLAENEFENNEFVNSLVKQVQDGTLARDGIKTELDKFYKDAADPEGTVERAMTYIQDKLGVTEQPSESPEPLATEEVSEFPQEQNTGSGAGWVIALAALAAAGGGGYYWYTQKIRKREAAQRIAKKKVAQQQMQQRQGQAKADPNKPASAQNAAKVRTGTYTGTGSSARPKATPTASSGRQGSGKAYGKGSTNPYRRYTTSGSEEEASYTASFKPEAEEKVHGNKPETPKEDPKA